MNHTCNFGYNNLSYYDTVQLCLIYIRHILHITLNLALNGGSNFGNG